MFIKGISFYTFLIAIWSIIIANTKTYFLIVFVALLIVFVLKKYNYKVALVLSLVSIFFSFYKINKEPQITQGYINQEFVVIEAKEKYLITSSNDANYLIYIDENIYQKKDKLNIEGEVNKLTNDLEIDIFDFTDYLKNKRVYYSIIPYEIKIISTNNSISNNIVNHLLFGLENESFNMSKMLLFNDKNADIDSYNNLKEINAVHLFVVSGFHISFLFNLISFLLKKFKKLSIILGILVCTFYVFLLDFSISATRALISLILSKVFSKQLSRIDYIGIPGLILLLIEPLNIYNYSFIMSFLLVTTITLSSNILKEKNKFIQTILLSVICFLVMIPIQLLLNYKINFISLLTNIILTYVVMIIFVLCIVGIFIKSFNGNIFSFIYKAFNELISKISDLNTSILFGSINWFGIILFYVIFILFLMCLEKKKYKKVFLTVSLFGLYMFGLYNRGYLNFYQQVTFLNVYQGDCTIIQDSFTNKTMLIDTGGIINYDIASKKIMPYLNYHGIRKIDIVVTTHDDYDHCGALESLSKQIKIDKIIKDPYLKEIKLGKIRLTNLNKYFDDYSSENDKSIVLYGNICNQNFIFTGDISKDIEKKIIDDYQLDVDILKVAHHGSNTSTCKEFVENIKPEYAIISVGENNYYGHPTKQVLDILNENDVFIYRTDINGSIRFKGKILDYLFIETAK